MQTRSQTKEFMDLMEKQEKLAREGSSSEDSFGEAFLKASIGSYGPRADLIGLPGLNEAATRQLSAMGVKSAVQLFGQYLAFGRDHETFLRYMDENMRVNFTGDFKRTKVENQIELCKVFDEKWEKISKF